MALLTFAIISKICKGSLVADLKCTPNFQMAVRFPLCGRKQSENWRRTANLQGKNRLVQGRGVAMRDNERSYYSAIFEMSYTTGWMQ